MLLSIPRKLRFLLIFLCSSLVVSLRSPLEPLLRTAGSPQGSEWCQCPPPFSVVVNRRDLELLDLKMLLSSSNIRTLNRINACFRSDQQEVPHEYRPLLLVHARMCAFTRSHDFLGPHALWPFQRRILVVVLSFVAQTVTSKRLEKKYADSPDD